MAPPPAQISSPSKATSPALPKAAERTSSRAYVTFLAGDGDYVKGAVGLAKGLKKVRSAYPLVVAVLPDVPAEHRRLLVAQGCVVREIEPVELTLDRSKLARAYYAINYCKLRLWEFVEYDKMIYLDGDIQVFDNIDHLFDMPGGYLYAVVDCLCATWGESCPESLSWPAELGPKPAQYFNGGMLMFEPSLLTYNNLMKTLKVTPPTAFAEQDFLNMFFKNKFKPISPVYNFLIAMLWRHPGNVDIDQIKVLHYCFKGSKPWKYMKEEANMDRDDVRMFVKRWWDIYDDPSLDSNISITGDDHGEKYKPSSDTNVSIITGNDHIEKYMVTLPKDGLLQSVVSAPSAA